MARGDLIIHVLALRDRGDRLTRQAADEAASMVRALGAKAILVEGAADCVGADGLLVVAPQDADPEPLGEGEPLQGRAAALLCVAAEPPEGSAFCARARKALRRRSTHVIARQLVIPPRALGTYGLEGELEKERLQGLVELLLVEADRLKANREGWEEPEPKIRSGY